MEDAAQTRDLLLKEYVEAGHISRQHEQLTRTSATVFVPTLLALAGYVLGSKIPAVVKAVLALAGLVASLLAVNVMRRHQLYYRSYITRARAIESMLKVGEAQILHLYSAGKGAADGSFTVSSKTAFTLFFLLIAVLFGASAFVYFYHLLGNFLHFPVPTS